MPATWVVHSGAMGGEEVMNDKQQTAISNHCRFAFETGLPMFGHKIMRGNQIVGSIVLTVNSGYE